MSLVTCQSIGQEIALIQEGDTWHVIRTERTFVVPRPPCQVDVLALAQWSACIISWKFFKWNRTRWVDVSWDDVSSDDRYVIVKGYFDLWGTDFLEEDVIPWAKGSELVTLATLERL